MQIDLTNLLTQKPTIVGVSGGPDSTCLLRLLHEASTPVVAAHVNYGLRGAESDGDEAFVRELCAELGVRLEVLRVRAADRARVGVQAWAREVRMQFFSQIAAREHATQVALAHTQDDQAETVAFRLLRGADPLSVGGMRAREQLEQYNIELVRPLLHARKAEILTYLTQHNFTYRTDSSNATTKYTRNKIRNILFPAIAKNHDPIALFAKIGEQAQEISEGLAAQIPPEVFRARDVIDRAVFLQQPSLIQQQIIHRIAPTASSAAISRVLALAATHSSGQISPLTGTTHIIIEADALKITDAATVVVPASQLLQQNSSVDWADRWRIAFGQQADQHILIDTAKTGTTLIVRARQSGDRIHLATGSKKLQDLFVDAKIPRRERDLVPIVTTQQGEIIWVVGVRADRRFAATTDSPTVATLSAVRYTTRTDNQ